jgi:hypothetical protein
MRPRRAGQLVARALNTALGDMDGIPLNSTGVAVLAAVLVAGILAAKWFRGSFRMPPQKAFRCARCSSVESHTKRTIEAWRAGKSKLFCGACHAQWLKSQPSHATGAYSRSGCLSVLVVAALLPGLAIVAYFCICRIA